MKLRKQTGVAALEFALILIPMLILILGVTELGRALFQYEGVVKATRGAARYLTQKNLNDNPTYNAAVAVAKSLALCGKQTCASGDPFLVDGLNLASQVTVTKYPNVPTGEGTLSLVSVKITGVKFKSVIPGGNQLLGFIDATGQISFPPITITMAYSTT